MVAVAAPPLLCTYTPPPVVGLTFCTTEESTIVSVAVDPAAAEKVIPAPQQPELLDTLVWFTTPVTLPVSTRPPPPPVGVLVTTFPVMTLSVTVSVDDRPAAPKTF